MSKEAARTFYRKLVQDEALTSRVNEAATVDERLAIARREGCEFTRSEFEAVTAEIVDSDKSFAEVFGGDQGEIVGYAALSMVQARNVVRPLYWGSWFHENGQIAINRPLQR